MARSSKLAAWPARLLLAVLGAMLPLLAAAQEPEVWLGDLPINGEWEVVYADRLLGFVTGRGEIDEAAGSARVTFVHPVTGQEFSLRSRSFSRSGTKITIEFEGKSPTADSNDGLGYPQRHLIVSEETREVTARVGANSATNALAARFESDLDRVTLELTLDDQDTLHGTWRYQADPFTGRDRNGFGRVGLFELKDDGTARQTGSEVWTRPEPEIFGTFVLSNQMTYAEGFSDLPSYPHPFQDNQNREDTDYRTLVIFGQNLPQSPNEPAIFISETKQISYEFIRYGARIRRLDHDLDDLSKAQNALISRLPKEVPREVVEALDYVIVRAVLKEGVLPGYHSFTMNGKVDTWLLKFGDNRAQIKFIRRIRPTSAGAEGRDAEPTFDVFIPEKVQIEIRTDLVLDVAEIQVIVGRNGRLLRLGPSGPKIPARRVPGRPKVYRTNPIELVKPSGGVASVGEIVGQVGQRLMQTGPYVIPVNVNDVLTAAIAEPGLISDEARPAFAMVRQNPAQSGVDASFEVYLRKAIECTELEVEDWDKLSHAKIETITEYRLFWWDTLNTTIQIGDHAAMLMMRDTFVSLMLDRLEAFLNIKSDVQVIAFRNDFERAITKLEHAMRDIRVPGPDGNEIAFWETYETSNRSTLMRHESLEVEPWVLNATRAALKQYQEILVSTINVAATIDDCDDMEELLELTGRSFQVVIYRLNPRLMQPSAISGATRQPGWTPDYEARFRIWRIAQLADQVKTFDTLSTTDTYFIFAAGAILSIPVSAVSATAGLILAYAEIGYVIYDSHDQYSRSQAEIEFARGTIEVLGYRRLQRAKAEEYSAIRLAVAIGHTAMFEAVGYSIGRAIPNIFAQFRLARRIAGVRRGRELLRKYNFDPEAVPGNLGARAYREMLDFVADANWLRAASMSMDDDQIKLFRRLEQLEREFLARPRWARSLDDAAHNDLKPYYGRRDIAQLMKRSSGSRVVLAALRYGGRVREEAFKVLQLPHRTAKQFRRALNARLARKTGPFGEDVYDLGSLNNSAAATVVREGHWFFNFRRSSGQNELQIRIYSPDGKVDEDLFRGFNTEKGILFMKAAFRKNVPGRLDVGLAPEIFPKGFPAFLFAQLRYLHEIGVAYAGRVGIALKQVVMKSIVNARTNVQLAWFRKTYYPGKSFQQLVDEGLLDEFLRQTRSVQYAETVINMAGYRIKRVTLDLAGDDVPLKVMAEFYKAGRSGETWKQFLKRYGLRGNDLGPPGFNIKIEVEPDPNAFRNVAASDTPPRPPGGGGGSPPGGRPPDGGPPSGGGTAAAGGAEPEYMQTMAGLRQEVDEIWEKARARVQKGMEDDTDIMPDTAAEFERASERHMTLEAMESAVEEARRAGVPDDVIADHVANFRHFERDANRMSQVNQLNERTLALEGVDTFIPMVDAGEMAILLGRVRAGTTSPEDLRNLRDLFQHAADQGGDFIDDLRRMQVVTPDVSTEPLANAYTLRKLRELAERENLFPTRTAPPESPAPDLPPSVLDQVEQRLAGLDPAEREARRLSAEMLVRMGVPSESAADFAVASTRSLTGSDGGGAVSPLRRAIFLADGIMLHGSRRVDLDEFAQVTGLDSRTVDVGAQAAAVERGLAPLPGQILPARLYPPVGF